MSPCGIEPVRVLGQNEPKMQTPWMEDPDMSVLRLGGVRGSVFVGSHEKTVQASMFQGMALNAGTKENKEI